MFMACKILLLSVLYDSQVLTQLEKLITVEGKAGESVSDHQPVFKVPKNTVAPQLSSQWC